MSENKLNIVPKFCTNIKLALLATNNVILTMRYEQEEDNILIERVLIDLDHVRSLKESLDRILEESDE